MMFNWKIILLDFLIVAIGTQIVLSVDWIVAQDFESHASTCARVNMNPFNMADYPLVWNFENFNYIVTTVLNTTIDTTNGNEYGINGCCAPGLWCSDNGCFTQGFGESFSNYGWLNNATSILPVFTCNGAATTNVTIATSGLSNGILKVGGNGFTSSDQYSIANIYGETCSQLEGCDCIYCGLDPDKCPPGYICVSSYCLLQCSGHGDDSCPCDQTCSTIVDSGDASIYACYDTTTLLTTCNSHSGHFTCNARRAYQSTYQALSNTHSNRVNISIVMDNNGDTALTANDLSTGYCQANSDCADGNICTTDSCDTTTGLCIYTTLAECNSMPQSITERNTAYMYYNYYAQGGNLTTIQTTSVQYLLSVGTVSTVLKTDDFPMQQVTLPFNLIFFGNLVRTAYISPNGMLVLPPSRPCTTYQNCLLFATSSNLISPFYTDWDPKNSPGSSIVYYNQLASGPEIFGVTADAFHVLYNKVVRYSSGSNGNIGSGGDSALGTNPNTFAASIYKDSSIRLSFITIDTELKTSDYFGIWGSFASSYNSVDGTYLRYHEEEVKNTNAVNSSEVVYCSIETTACPLESCVTANESLLVRWNGTTTCTALGDGYEIQLSCAFAGGLASSMATLSLPSENTDLTYSTLSCPVPEMNFTDGTVVLVDIIISAVRTGSTAPVYVVNANDPPGSKSIFTTYMGEYQELARSVMMIRYYGTTDGAPVEACGCGVFSELGVNQCDNHSVCGGNNTSNVVDCAGVPYGAAITTACETCAGGLTGITPHFTCNDDDSSNMNNIISQTIILLMIICCMIFLTMSVTYSVRRMLAMRALRDDLERFNEQIILAENEVVRRQRNGLGGTGSTSRGLSEFERDALGEIKFSKDFYEKHKREMLEEIRKGGDIESAPEAAVAGDLAGAPAHTAESDAACECTICLMEIEEGSACRALPAPCGHIFHVECIDQWFQQSFLCPLCKRSIRSILLGSDNDPGSRESSLVQDLIFLRPNFALRLMRPFSTAEISNQLTSAQDQSLGVTTYREVEMGPPVRYAARTRTSAQSAQQLPAGRTFSPSRAATTTASSTPSPSSASSIQALLTASTASNTTTAGQVSGRAAEPSVNPAAARTSRAGVQYQGMRSRGDSADSTDSHDGSF